MKLISFKKGSYVSWGAVVGDAVVDLRAATSIDSLNEAIAIDALKRLTDIVEKTAPAFKLEDLELLAVIPKPPKIFCVGTNYHDHRIETGREVPDYPVIFSRFSNSQVGHNHSIVRPKVSEQLDFEGEIAVIISKKGRHIEERDAWEYVAGYAAYNDATIRDWQRHTHQWIPGKNFPATGAFGPWMVTRDEIADGEDIHLITRLNGVEVQKSSASLMIFSIPKILSYISQFTEFEPGDVVVTGTPGGVGGKRNPPLWMKPGDLVEVDVGKVGVLRNTIKDE
jgi:2-keto-4-pentenoate hydratase/2-oxohepta-3-ene-1,7-dioic acid hydratase in catechol pathway